MSLSELRFLYFQHPLGHPPLPNLVAPASGAIAPNGPAPSSQNCFQFLHHKKLHVTPRCAVILSTQGHLLQEALPTQAMF